MVNAIKAPLYGLKTSFYRFKTFINLLRTPIKAFVQLIEANFELLLDLHKAPFHLFESSINFLKAPIHLLESVFHVSAQVAHFLFKPIEARLHRTVLITRHSALAQKKIEPVRKILSGLLAQRVANTSR